MADLVRTPETARLWERALDLIFPPRCVSCNSFGAFVCERCLSGMGRADPPRCKVCWVPAPGRAEGLAEEEIECARCHGGQIALKGLRSVFVYEGAARGAVHALKFRGLSALASLMAALMAERLLEWSPPVQTIVPVPLAGPRRRLRGYNQSELLAKEISRLSAVPVARRALVRRRGTPPQVRQPDEWARRRNVAGAFAAGRTLPTGGVLLIDDVVTTGATLDACARVLISEGAGPVFALTFARED